MSDESSSSPAFRPDIPGDAGPRWFALAQPRIQGVATYEWNAMTGTAWFSEEWETIIQSPYDWTLPNNQEWWLARIHPEDKARFQRCLFAVYSGLVDAHDLTCRIKRGDGAWLHVLLRSRVTYKTPSGGPWIVSGILIDLTEYFSDGCREAQAVVLSGQEYHTMLENSPDLFIRFDRNTVPTYVNPNVDRLLGGKRLGRASREEEGRRIVGNGLELFRPCVNRVFAGQRVVRSEMTLDMTDGSHILGDCSFWPEFDSSGTVRHCMMQFRDITEKRRMEERAALNEKRLEALYRLSLMENYPEDEVLRFVMDSMLEVTRSRSGFFFIPKEPGSDEGRLLWSSDHYRDYDHVYLPDGHLPQDLIMQMTDSDGNRVYRSVKNNAGDKPLYVVFGGAMRVMRGILAPVTEGRDEVCIAGVCNKATDYDETDLQQFETFINNAWQILRRRRIVRELQRAKDAAESANKAKDAFLANVSHELRTPLNGVLSMLELIDSLPLGEEQREHLHTAQFSGKALLRIISDILDYSGMESGKMPLAVDVFDFQSAVASALRIFRERAERDGLEFSVRIDSDIPRALLGDEARVRQIVFNVVGNAVKFTPEGSIAVFCALAPQEPDGKVRVTITVRDTGIGIPADKLETIFEAFAQVETSHRRRYGGTGLGLSIVKHLVALMHGTVRVESELGKGAAVFIDLRFDRPDPARFPAERSPAVFPVAEMALDILVVEDDRVGSIAMREFLRRRGHRAVCVEDGGEALEALQLYPFHCVFTDITMPVVDGLELVRRIRARDVGAFPPSDAVRVKINAAFPGTEKPAPADFSGIIVVAVSAHSMIGDKDRFLEQGMDYYIAKPVDKDELDGALAFAARKAGRTA